MEHKLTISNTDVITMLVVKNREHLNKRLVEEHAKLKQVNDQISSLIDKSIQKELNKPTIKAIVNNYKFMVKAFMDYKKVKTKMDVVCQNLDRIYHYNFDKWKTYKGIVISDLSFSIILEDEDLFKNIPLPPHFEDLNIPCKIIPKIPSALINQHIAVQAEVTKIHSLLNNEQKMKDELTAKMTENAIRNSSELQIALGINIDDILLLN